MAKLPANGAPPLKEKPILIGSMRAVAHESRSPPPTEPGDPGR